MNNKDYKCIFFDLDHTLWDYETNSCEALKELYDRYNLGSRGAEPFEHFYEGFVRINTEIWDSYDRGLVGRDAIRFERFHRVFLNAGINDYDESLKFSEDYVTESPRRKNLVPHAKELLDYLHDRYPMFIITNGFDEIQSTKLDSAGITGYFNGVVTSARAGFKKPQREIFEFALRQNGFDAADTIMVGDNLLTDMAGARNASIDSVFFNPNKVSHDAAVTYEINSLQELHRIL